MKKIIAAVMCILFCTVLLSGCTDTNDLAKAHSEIIRSNTNTDNTPPDNETYVRAIWIAYYELEGFTKDAGESEFYDKVDTAFQELSKMGFNTVTVQVRPCADAFYKSAYFPSSRYCFGEQGGEMPYDPLYIMCNIAHQYKLKLEAWINPYRVSQDNDIEKLSDSNKAKVWYKDEDTKTNVYIDDAKIYFNPASEEVTELIVNGAKEIAENYEVDAIHFDDYFYPTTDSKIDETEYAAYTADGGKLSLADWRRENVSNMIKSVYDAVKSVNSDIRFGISPAANIKNDYSELYADVEKWVSEEGYVDYIVPQIYFGFKNIYQPFMFTTKKWINLTSCDLYVGLPLYKSGKPDEYAAKEDEAIINEFVNNDDIVARQITYLSKLEEVKGFYVFSFEYLTDENAKKEVENMMNAMQNSNQD